MEERSKIYAGFLNDAAVIRLTGHATVLVAPLLKQFQDKNRDAILQKPRLIYDLTECNFVDSTILGLISHLSVAYFKINGKFGTLIYADDKVKNILETLNCNKILDMIYVPPELSTVAPLQEVNNSQAFDKAAIRASVAQAHQALVELNENNAALFSEVLADLKLPPHS
jgi:anti-anti-sigma regulatory factor